ncbi:MAG TPA: hypothetical protein VFG49_13305 [Dyella sp.]|uniref:hypothetical protein n=1 Tax=Dyella sp. TaxID=1869338 RepID=UPI002D766A74|nr:hypothetical protein [Dyella sp.]HET6554497.1 hypothetical protein [Dyella sp.]
MHHRRLLAGLCAAGAITLSSPTHAADVANSTYVAELQQTPLFLAMNQPTIEALYAGVEGPLPPSATTTQPMSWKAIGVTSVGNALGMAIVSATAKADSHNFAETHIAGLREATRSMGLEQQLQQAILESSGNVAWLSGGSTHVVSDDKELAPSPDMKAWLVLHARYALSTDFSHVVVVADVELFRQAPGDTSDRWRRKPAFHNVLVFQSAALHVPDKVPADTERMIADENARWDQAAINAEIDRLNKQGLYDTVAIKQRRAVVAKQEQHKKNLAEARTAKWSRNQLGYEYARRWGDHDAAALRQALRDGGLEVGRMLALTFSGQHDNVGVASTDGTSTASSETPRRLDYLQPNGDVMSVLGDDKPMIGPYLTGS